MEYKWVVVIVVLLVDSLMASSISFSHQSGISMSCVNGKCKTVKNSGGMSVDCKDGKCKKSYSGTQCANGKCTHDGKPIPEPEYNEPSFGYPTPPYEEPFHYNGGFGNFRECSEGAIMDMYPSTNFRMRTCCMKTICINGMWTTKEFPGNCPYW